MTEPVDVELAQEAGKRARAEIMALLPDLLSRNQGPNGETYGSLPMDHGARIEAFLLRARNGSLDHLQVISPEQYEDYVAEYVRDVGASPMFGHSRSDDAIRESEVI